MTEAPSSGQPVAVPPSGPERAASVPSVTGIASVMP